MARSKSYAETTGKAPIQRQCPTCSKMVGGMFLLGRFQIAIHHKPAGGRCRTLREVGTGKNIPQPKGA
jgi:hypothetical protein